MELSELTKKILGNFNAESVEELPKKIMTTVLRNEKEKYQAFKNSVQDLSIDWLQRIFQYHLADRKEKMQDYTPKSLAQLMGALALRKGETKIVDMCAGSGALTIQTWNLNHETEFECLEFDENVLPLLLFNLAVRNIKATVKHTDVLQNDVMAIYQVTPREEYSEVRRIDNNN
ncbi:N-6 DNA methylase [Enterococcus olivae]